MYSLMKGSEELYIQTETTLRDKLRKVKPMVKVYMFKEI